MSKSDASYRTFAGEALSLGLRLCRFPNRLPVFYDSTHELCSYSSFNLSEKFSWWRLYVLLFCLSSSRAIALLNPFFCKNISSSESFMSDRLYTVLEHPVQNRDRSSPVIESQETGQGAAIMIVSFIIEVCSISFAAIMFPILRLTNRLML